MRLRAGVVSDVGHVRSANEDSFILRPGLYAVCDGMGGARAGEVASQMACLGLLGVDPASAGREELRQAVVKTNQAIIQRSASEGELLGMGTTLTAALIKDDEVLVAHVGDSRAYLLREGELAQMTDDHSWVGEMVRRGEITLAQAARHPHRSVITRALGTDQDLAPDLVGSRIMPGDRLLLCSDGLTGMVGDEIIAHIMGLGADAQTTAQSLVDAALENGGEDNVTVVVIDVKGAGDDSEESEAASWSDARILIGPSERAASASSRGIERLSLAGRERLRRRGVVIPRAGGRSSVGRRGTGSIRPEEPSEEDVSPGSDAKPAAPPADTSEAGGAGPGIVPPPKGEKRKRRPAKVSEGRKRRRKRLVATIIVLLILVLAAFGFAWYNSTVYYLGVSDGKVSLYQGLPWHVLGLEFSSVYMQATVGTEALSAVDLKRVLEHDHVGKVEGAQFLDGLSTEL